MQGLPSDRNSTSLAPPTTAAPEAVFVERALLEARRAHVHGSARLGEVVHQLLEWREALLVNAVRKSFLRETHAFHGQEDERLLAGADGGVEIGRAPSELQSQSNLVCRLLLEKKKNTQTSICKS